MPRRVGIPRAATFSEFSARENFRANFVRPDRRIEANIQLFIAIEVAEGAHLAAGRHTSPLSGEDVVLEIDRVTKVITFVVVNRSSNRPACSLGRSLAIDSLVRHPAQNGVQRKHQL